MCDLAQKLENNLLRLFLQMLTKNNPQIKNKIFPYNMIISEAKTYT